MSALQTPPDYSSSDAIHCKRCNTILPALATFCGVCGERVGKDVKKQPDTTDVSEQYRIVSLVRRRTYEQLFLAIDNKQQKPVVISDIDISSLNEEKRTEAIKATQHEYDLLRRHRTPDVMPVIDLRYFQGHLFTISGWPFPTKDIENKPANTLQDLLQSGIGLPDEQTAILWMYRLAQAVSNLHEQLIVIGDLDPYTIIISDNSYDAMPALMVGWLPLPVRSLLPQESAQVNTSHHFTAPEALLGNVEPGSDVYSLGAILYLLLTGTAPTEPGQRKQQTLRSPREINSHVGSRVDEVVMHALALEIEDRFESAEELADALLQLCSTTKTVHGGNNTPQKKVERTDRQQKRTKAVIKETISPPEETDDDPSEDQEEVTISVAPIQAQLARWYMSRVPTGNLKSQEVSEHKITQEKIEEQRIEEIAQQATRSINIKGNSNLITENQEIEETQIEPPEPLPEPLPRPLQTTTHDTGEQPEQPTKRNLKNRITGVLPAFQHLGQSRAAGLTDSTDPSAVHDDEKSFLKRLQRFILGEQQRSTTAAALIETPLRIQPNQGYSLRIHLMGRDMPVPPPGAKKGTPPAGLSALVHGENVHIEVRSALFQNYAYIVQRADVQIPARGYAAEVTIPMQALTNGRSGRRERLHIFFMDADHKPLYEKPFVIELFISHLVQSGREGHNVLSIPL